MFGQERVARQSSECGYDDGGAGVVISCACGATEVVSTKQDI